MATGVYKPWPTSMTHPFESIASCSSNNNNVHLAVVSGDCGYNRGSGQATGPTLADQEHMAKLSGCILCDDLIVVPLDHRPTLMKESCEQRKRSGHDCIGPSGS